MPGFDGTGPRGEGPMTGGARGYCAIPAPRAGRGLATGLIGAVGRWFAGRPGGMGGARFLGRGMGIGRGGRGRRW